MGNITTYTILTTFCKCSNITDMSTQHEFQTTKLWKETISKLRKAAILQNMSMVELADQLATEALKKAIEALEDTKK